MPWTCFCGSSAAKTVGHDALKQAIQGDAAAATKADNRGAAAGRLDGGGSVRVLQQQLVRSQIYIAGSDGKRGAAEAIRSLLLSAGLNSTANGMLAVVVHAPGGGFGVTEAAREFCFRSTEGRQRYPSGIFWIRADSGAGTTAVLAELAAAMERASAASQPPSSDDAAVLSKSTFRKTIHAWAKSHSGWLLVLDGVDSGALLKEVLPPVESRGHVIITTRTATLPALAAACPRLQLKSNNISVLPLESADAATLLLCARAGARAQLSFADAAVAMELDALTEGSPRRGVVMGVWRRITGTSTIGDEPRVRDDIAAISWLASSSRNGGLGGIPLALVLAGACALAIALGVL